MKKKKRIVEEKLLSGQYANLRDMATDINDGRPSKVIEEIIFHNMINIMLQKFNE